LNTQENFMHRAFPFATLLLVVSCLALAQPSNKLTPEPAPDFSGYYAVQGEERISDTEVGKYHGVALIEKHGPVYAVQYTFPTSSSSGVGQLKNGVLAVGWRNPKRPDAVGCTVYTRRDNDLVGIWTAAPGSGLAQRETLVWLKHIGETGEPPAACKEPSCACGDLCSCKKPCCCGKEPPCCSEPVAKK
jgi:hypothetical protein